MLGAARRITEVERYVRNGNWKGWRLKQWLGIDVHHATLGIIGMGRIGQAIAKRAAGFDMRWDSPLRGCVPPYETQDSAIHEKHAQHVGWDAARADVAFRERLKARVPPCCRVKRPRFPTRRRVALRYPRAGRRSMLRACRTIVVPGYRVAPGSSPLRSPIDLRRC